MVKMKRLSILFAANLLAGLVHADNRPNIVIVMTDDLGWMDVGYHGSEIKTPRLDELAAKGLVLDQFRVQPTCSPTRASLLTGKSSLRLGVIRPIAKIQPKGLGIEETTVAEHLKEAGYQTFLAGKWHLGFARSKYLPNQRGFDEFYGFVTGGIGYWDHVHGGGYDWQRDGVTLRESGYSTELIAKEAVRLIKDREKEKPLFLFASFNAPHLPNEAPPKALAAASYIDDPLRQGHAAMIGEFDFGLGQIVDALSEEGIINETLIWFMSDNGGLNAHPGLGPMVPLARWIDDWLGSPAPTVLLEFIRTNALEGASSNGSYRRGKGSIYEGGVHVPSVIHWPEHIDPGRSASFITVQDVTPTLLGIAGIGSKNAFDGVDHSAQLVFDEKLAEIPDYFTSGNDGEAVYRWPWKLIANNDDHLELYNLESDPYERHDQSSLENAMANELQDVLIRAPRGESIHVPFWKSLLDPDFFGGEEDRMPWADTVVSGSTD